MMSTERFKEGGPTSSNGHGYDSRVLSSKETNELSPNASAKVKDVSSSESVASMTARAGAGVVSRPAEFSDAKWAMLRSIVLGSSLRKRGTSPPGAEASDERAIVIRSKRRKVVQENLAQPVVAGAPSRGRKTRRSNAKETKKAQKSKPDKPTQSVPLKTKKSNRTIPLPNFDYVVWESFDKLPQGLYKAIKELWPADLMDMLEPEEAMHIAHRYHMASIPPNGQLKVLVLGESHSRTPRDLIGRHIPDRFDFVPEKMRHLGHLNLVHCLSYGDINLVVSKEESASYPKPSTATWWKVLATLAGRCDPDPITGTDPLAGCPTKTWTEPFNNLVCGLGGQGPAKRQQLVQNKVQILEDMERFGIGLMDISPIAIFLASGTETKTNQKTGNKYLNPVKKLDSRSYSAIMELCWTKYMLPFITEHIKPNKIVVLGDSFFKFLEKQGLESLRNVGISINGFVHPSARTYQQSRYVPILRKLRDETAYVRNDQSLTSQKAPKEEVFSV